MNPIYVLWLGLLSVYLVVTGRAEVTIQAWRDAAANLHKKKE